jgi:hypothetical protein
MRPASARPESALVDDETVAAAAAKTRRMDGHPLAEGA